MQRLTPLALASILLGLQPHAALAQDTPPSSGLYHLYIGALYNNADSHRDLVSYGTGFTGSLGIPLTAVSKQLHLEIGGNWQSMPTPVGTASNFFRSAGTASLMYAFGDRDQLTPYVIGGMGIARNDTTYRDQTSLSLHGGGGLTQEVWRGVRARGELLGVFERFDGRRLFDPTLSVGVEVPLGRVQTVTVERIVTLPAPAVAPAEPREVIKEIIKEVVVPPPDSDGDHIADTDDKCPGTLQGLRTDNQGCAIAQALTLSNIEFNLNKATLRPESQAQIDEAIAFLRQQPNLRAVVAGHTDSHGNPQRNQKLSQARAETVVHALLKGGLAASRFKAVGLGASMPVEDNSTDAGRAHNRRVEFLLSTSSAN